jgi:hypothetical protein
MYPKHHVDQIKRIIKDSDLKEGFKGRFGYPDLSGEPAAKGGGSGGCCKEQEKEAIIGSVNSEKICCCC